MTPLEAVGALAGVEEDVLGGGRGGEALDGEFLPFLFPLVVALAD